MASIQLPNPQPDSLLGEAIIDSPTSDPPQPIFPLPGEQVLQSPAALSPTDPDTWPPRVTDDNRRNGEDEALRRAAANLLADQSHPLSSDHQMFSSASFQVTPQQAADAVSNATMSSSAGPSRQSTLQSEVRSPAGSRSQSKSSKLPRDDGFAALRHRIQAVGDQKLSAEEKAQMVRNIMMESYTGPAIPAHRYGSRSPPPVSERVRAPRPRLVDGSPDPQANQKFSTIRVDGLQMQPSGPHEYQLAPADREPTYVPEPAKLEGEDLGQDMDCESEDPRAFGCAHYRRNVKLECVDCLKWYTCRFCHDEVEDHPLIRAATRHMLCMFCGTPQPCAAECSQCGESGGCYYCDKCKLWDNAIGKQIYHCDDCGLCRVGKGLGADFFHCQRCGVCMSVKLLNSHRCIERSTDCDCPICGSYMFSSTRTVVFMRCGHSIHYQCYYDHMKRSYKCPLCSKSVVNMEMQFRNLDRSIAAQPMPPEYTHTTALINCNDCSAKTVTPYHWLGLKCTICQSYNTSQIKVNGPGPQPTGDVAEPPLPPHPAAPGSGQHGVSDHPIDPSRPPSVLGVLPPDAHPAARAAPSSVAGTSATHRQAFPGRAEGAALPLPPYPSLQQPERDEDAVVLSEDEDWSDEMDFWGGEVSPRSHHSLRSATGTDAADKPSIEDLDLDISSSSSEEDDLPGDDELEAGDVEWEDRMDLPGHR